MNALQTRRLTLRWLEDVDANFILELVNEPSWLQFIGDRGVRTVADARAYMENGPQRMYRERGFGLYLVERSADKMRMGLCGLIKRDTLEDVDIGYAFLPRYWGHGYAREAAAAVLEQGHQQFGLQRIVAITSKDNHSSIRLLQDIGMRFEKTLYLPNDARPTQLFAWHARPASAENHC